MTDLETSEKLLAEYKAVILKVCGTKKGNAVIGGALKLNLFYESEDQCTPGQLHLRRCLALGRMVVAIDRALEQTDQKLLEGTTTFVKREGG